jgi:hypothetical protein
LRASSGLGCLGYPRADHFAEKLHAYTRPRERRTRVKDLLDLALILEDLRDDLPSAATMKRTIDSTCDRYDTHALPAPLPAPPEDWARSFEDEARDLELATTNIEGRPQTLGAAFGVGDLLLVALAVVHGQQM